MKIVLAFLPTVGYSRLVAGDESFNPENKNMNMLTCSDCKYWTLTSLEDDVTVGICCHSMVIRPAVYRVPKQLMRPDSVLTADEGGATGELITGPKFGCVHLKPVEALALSDDPHQYPDKLILDNAFALPMTTENMVNLLNAYRIWSREFQKKVDLNTAYANIYEITLNQIIELCGNRDGTTITGPNQLDVEYLAPDCVRRALAKK